jgi:hypothetical protein
VGDRPHLLGHCEAVLSQSTLWRVDGEMERAAEIGSGERDGQRETETRLVQLVD